MITIAVIGLGNRGSGYMHWTKALNSRKAKIVALCDHDEYRLRSYAKKYGIPEDKCFLSDVEFFKTGKLADAIYICTMDRLHYGHAMKAIDCGYHIMLEKPVSPNIDE
ncbi:MAG: Gfo/Idh/MocA family oxidoreductase, partial [Clostridia bacterium]